MLKGAMAAQTQVGLMLNVPRADLDEVLGVLPALNSPDGLRAARQKLGRSEYDSGTVRRARCHPEAKGCRRHRHRRVPAQQSCVVTQREGLEVTMKIFWIVLAVIAVGLAINAGVMYLLQKRRQQRAERDGVVLYATRGLRRCARRPAEVRGYEEGHDAHPGPRIEVPARGVIAHSHASGTEGHARHEDRGCR